MAARSKKVDNRPSIEESFARLDQITEQMEQEEITLEDSFALFREGMELIKQCGEQLQDVEKQMIILENEWSEENS